MARVAAACCEKVNVYRSVKVLREQCMFIFVLGDLLCAACVCVSTHARGYGIPYGIGGTGDTSKMLKMTPNRVQI